MTTIDTKSLSQKEVILKFHAKKAGITVTHADALWDGLDQFLQLCSENPGTYQVASQPVDELWHDFLQFTEAYADYCQNRFGKMIHHLPATHSTPVSGYMETRDILEKKLGTLSAIIWPVLERAEWSVGYAVK